MPSLTIKLKIDQLEQAIKMQKIYQATCVNKIIGFLKTDHSDEVLAAELRKHQSLMNDLIAKLIRVRNGEYV